MRILLEHVFFINEKVSQGALLGAYFPTPFLTRLSVSWTLCVLQLFQVGFTC